MDFDQRDYLIFSLDQRLYALLIECIERVVLVPRITPIHDAPAGLMVFFNLRGCNVPVLNLRRRFGLPDCKMRPSDALIICRVNDHRLALWVDEARRVCSGRSIGCVPPGEVWPGLDHLQGLAHVDEEIVAVLAPASLLPEHPQPILARQLAQASEG